MSEENTIKIIEKILVEIENLISVNAISKLEDSFKKIKEMNVKSLYL